MDIMTIIIDEQCLDSAIKVHSWFSALDRHHLRQFLKDYETAKLVSQALNTKEQ